MLGIKPSLSLHIIMEANCSEEENNKVIRLCGSSGWSLGLESSKDLIVGVGSLFKSF